MVYNVLRKTGRRSETPEASSEHKCKDAAKIRSAWDCIYRLFCHRFVARWIKLALTMAKRLQILGANENGWYAMD